MRNVLFLPLLIQLVTSLVIARLDSVKNGLLFGLSQCVVPNGPSDQTVICTEFGKNVIQWLRCVSSCWRTSLLKCTEHQNRQADMYIHTEMMCGVLNTGMPISQLLDKEYYYYETFIVYSNFTSYLYMKQLKNRLQWRQLRMKYMCYLYKVIIVLCQLSIPCLEMTTRMYFLPDCCTSCHIFLM